MKTSIVTLALAALAASHGAVAAAYSAGFEYLPLAPDSHFFPKVTTTFTDAGATFNHTFTDFGGDCCHTDWVYSNRTDTTTGDYSNQHSAITGGGAEGSAQYAIANFGAPSITFASAVTVQGAYVTNTTFTALAMLDGDAFGFSKKFGGSSGDDPDYLRLTIMGKDGNGVTTGSVYFMLADYQTDDHSLDYVVTDWRWVDLTALGSSVRSLQFALASSDTGAFGINTPAYFALDNLTVTAVPEPEQAALLLAGLALVGAIARRRRA